jgi:CheY-like chemotaxis protein
MNAIRVMIVEDEVIVALDIRNTLRRMGYSVTWIADSGENAVEMALDNNPDLILMDIRLRGETDGVEAAQRIRARREIPIIFLTAYADGPTRQRANTVGQSAYLLKPFNASELRSVIEKALAESPSTDNPTN